MNLNDLLRAEIDLPDDAPHVVIMNLLGEAQNLYSETANKDDRRTIDRAMERLTSRIVPKQDGRIDPNLILELINIGNEIEAVNAHRASLYEKAGVLMQSAVETGMSQAEVARIVGVDRSTVKSAVARPTTVTVRATASGTVKKATRPPVERSPRPVGKTVTRSDGTRARLIPRPKPKSEDD